MDRKRLEKLKITTDKRLVIGEVFFEHQTGETVLFLRTYSRHWYGNKLVTTKDYVIDEWDDPLEIATAFLNEYVD